MVNFNKTHYPQLCLLAGIVICICVLHACGKEKDCTTCAAHKNGQLITTQEICSAMEKAAFELAYVDHDINCH